MHHRLETLGIGLRHVECILREIGGYDAVEPAFPRETERDGPDPVPMSMAMPPGRMDVTRSASPPPLPFPVSG